MQHATNPSETPSLDYIPSLDGLRAIAILLVLFAHFGFENIIPGGFGVTLFFFISGFLISRQITHNAQTLGRIDFKGFYLRRILRLMPALTGMIIISSILFIAAGGEITLGQFLTAEFYGANYYDIFHRYDSNLATIRHPFLILWSLSVEEHFYILFPALFALCYNHSRRYITLLIALLVAALLWRLYLWNICTSPLPHASLCGLRGDYRLYKATDTRFDSILYGVLLTAIYSRADMKAIRSALKSIPLFLAGIAALLISFLIRDSAFRETYRYTLQGLALMPIFAALLFNPWLSTLCTVLSQKPLIMIGKLSYSLYLYHWVGLMIGEIAVANQWLNNALPIAIITTIALTLISYHAIEQPMLRYRRKFGSTA